MFKVNYMALLGPTLPKVNAAIMSPTKPNYFHRTLIANVITQEPNLSNSNNKGVDFILQMCFHNKFVCSRKMFALKNFKFTSYFTLKSWGLPKSNRNNFS